MISRLLAVLALFVFCSLAAQAQVRKATYYAERYYGRLTSTGETLDPTLFTAASKRYDWGTILEVTNKKNGRTVQVKVNDCGPHHPQATLDLSQAAADELKMVRAGIVPISVRVVRASDAGPNCHRGAWAKKLKAAGKPIPPPPPAWDPVETAGSLPPGVITDTKSDVTTLPVADGSTVTVIDQGLVGFYPQNADKKKTSTGETYLHGGLTAASKSYPYNSFLQVTNVTNGKTVRVRVNDCGPVQPDRLLNISRAAAFELGILATGPAQMNVEVVKLGADGPTCDRDRKKGPVAATAPASTTTPSTTDTTSTASRPSTGPTDGQPAAKVVDPDRAPARSFDPDALLFGVKLAAFKSAESAKRLEAKLRSEGFSPVYTVSDGKFHRVYAGKFYFQSEAESYRDLLRDAGYEVAMVRRVQ